MWSWLACFGLLWRVAPSNVDVWRHHSSDRKREGRNVGVEVTEKQRLQSGVFLRNYISEFKWHCHECPTSSEETDRKNTNGVIVRSDMISNKLKKKTCALYRWPHLTDAIKSVSLFKNPTWKGIWGLNSVKSRTVVVWVVKLFSAKTSEKYATPNSGLNTAAARLLRQLVPTHQITRCHKSYHSKNQNYIHSIHIGYLWAAKTTVDPVQWRAWLLNMIVNHTNCSNIQNSVQSP